jgi:tRNA modification GTPase
VVLILDNSASLGRADRAIIDLVAGKKKVVVINKCDLPGRLDPKKIRSMFREDRVVEVSVAAKKNIPALEKAIADSIWSGDFAQGEAALLNNARHKELLDKALGNMLSVKKALGKKASPELVAIDLKEAIFDLGLVTGRSVSEDLLDRIFEKFCVGK